MLPPLSTIRTLTPAFSQPPTQVVVLKSLGFLKGAIEGGALSSTKNLLKTLTEDLKAEVRGMSAGEGAEIRGREASNS